MPASADDFESPKRKRRGNAPLPEISTDDFELPQRGDGVSGRDNDGDLRVYREAQRSYGKKRPDFPRDRLRRGPRRDIPPSQRPPRHIPSRQRRPAYQLNPMVKRITVLGIAGVTAIVVVILLAVHLMTDNAFAVYLDDRHMGYMNLLPDMDSESFHNFAISQLEFNLNAEVRVAERVRLRPGRAPASERLASGEMITRLTTGIYGFTVEIAAVDIYVNGSFEATLRSMADVEHLERMLQEPWHTAYTVRSEFVQDWELRPRFVDPTYQEFSTATDTQWRLERRKQVHVPYAVQPSENLGIIARNHGISLETILRDNPHINIHTILSIGQLLQIYTTRPLLSVRTFDYVNRIQPIPMPVQQVHNPSLAAATTRVVQYGRNGEEYAVTRITRVDGVLESEETLESRVISEPRMHIVEMGSPPPEGG
ncbi:MAG: G5 domain-containing protein [Defluviitaleaceae bacterium]|nr:G5 domain-containing protein [Defluviitaleaceae bacterium]